MTSTDPKPVILLDEAPLLIRRAKEHLRDYHEGSGSGLDSDACVHAAWHLRRDLTDVLPLLEQLLGQLAPTGRPGHLQAVPGAAAAA